MDEPYVPEVDKLFDHRWTSRAQTYVTAAGHFNLLLEYFMDTVSTGPNITDETYVDQSFMDTTIMHRFYNFTLSTGRQAR